MNTEKPAFTTPEGKEWLIGVLKSEEYVDVLFFFKLLWDDNLFKKKKKKKK